MEADRTPRASHPRPAPRDRGLLARLVLCGVLLSALSVTGCASMRDLGRVQLLRQLQEEGRNEDALSVALEILGERSERLGMRNAEVASAIHDVSVVMESLGRLGEAIQGFQAAAKMASDVRGPESAMRARFLTSLGSALLEDGQDETSLAVLQAAHEILSHSPDASPGDKANCLFELGIAHDKSGDYRSALKADDDALSLAPADPPARRARLLMNKSLVLRHLGRFEEAVAVGRDGLAALQRARTGSVVEIADAETILGGHLWEVGDLPGALALHEHALALQKSALGERSSRVATAHINLGGQYRKMARYDDAIRELSSAVAILDWSPPRAARAFIAHANLANAYLSAGQCQRALPLYKEALAHEASVPDDRRLGPRVMEGKAMTSCGDRPRGLAELAAVAREQESQLERAARFMSPRAAAAAFDQATQVSDIILEVALQTQDDSTIRLAASLVLARKGRDIDLQGDLSAALRSNPASLRAYRDLTSARAEYTRLAARRASPADPALAAIAQRVEALEATLGERAPRSRGRDADTQLERVLERVQATLADDEVLVEIVHATERYVAIVVHRSAVHLFALGSTTDVDAAVARFRGAIMAEQGGYDDAARAAYEALFRPIESRAQGKRRVLLSPSGSVSLVPFDALMRGDKFLFDLDYEFRYLTTGRQILPREKPTWSSDVVIVADPAFGATRSRGAPRFPPLAHGAEEARRIKDRLPGASVLTGREASKNALMTLEHVGILHISTHAWFNREPVSGVSDPQVSLLLQSGLALAGAQSEDDASEGRITAYELASMDLSRAQLVVLSACETGVGGAFRGQELYGLRRAVFAGGAATLVASLWRANAEATTELMRRFYDELSSGQDRLSALRGAMMAVRRSLKHPRYWAPFVLVGDRGPVRAGWQASGERGSPPAG